MASLALVCLGVLYVCLLLAVLEGVEVELRQWYHLPTQVRVIALLSLLCILLSAVFQTSSPPPAPRFEEKTKRANMEDDWSVQSWVEQDIPY
jgi:hypothetical protein